jgi:hypothetical protein
MVREQEYAPGRFIWEQRSAGVGGGAHDAHPVTWCCIQKLCINSGEGQKGVGRMMRFLPGGWFAPHQAPASE